MLVMPKGLEVEVLHNGSAVDACFDKNGSETFDLTEAIEVLSSGVLVKFKDGDELSMTVSRGVS